jgi:hypothetical protein
MPRCRERSRRCVEGFWEAFRDNVGRGGVFLFLFGGLEEEEEEEEEEEDE